MSEPTDCPILFPVQRLDEAAGLLVEACRDWPGAGGPAVRIEKALEASRVLWLDIQAMLSSGRTDFPLDVQNNLLIVSIYAQGKLHECEQSPSADKLATLLFLTRNLASSLKEWRAAA